MIPGSYPVAAAMSLLLAAVTTATALAAPQDFSQEAVQASKRAAAVRITEPIVIDGMLDEPAWAGADPAIDFYQQLPDEFAPATERSEVRFLYDDRMLYVGGVLYDPEPGRLIVNELRRDFSGFQNDVFTLIVDTFRDGRNGYGFMTNPGGAQRDVQISENGRHNDANWNGVWYVRTQIRDDGWSVEIGIPFKTLRSTGQGIQQWGLNMMRLVRHKNEFSTWSPVPRQFSHYAVGYAGVLTGIDAVGTGRDVRVTPFTTAQFSGGAGRTRDWSGNGDAGVDVKWGVTPSLLLDASYRTDFAQVEADEQQINFTRFSLFFPEKRTFFLENAASFQVGMGSVENERRDLVPFFSRRIGLSPTGQPIPVTGGLRLTGRAGRQGVGLLTMQTGDVGADPGANFTVAGLTREIAPTATAGAFYFGRETAGSDSFNRVGGIDLLLTPRREIEIEAFAMRSETRTLAGDWAGRAGFRLDTNAHRARLGLVHVGEAFRHDLGFVRRRGIASLFGSYERLFRPGNTQAVVREHGVRAEVEATGGDRYERMLTQVGSVTSETSFRDGSIARARVSSTIEHLDAPFTVGSDLTIAPGRYAFETVGVEYQWDPSATISGNLEIELGEYWNGNRQTSGGGVRVRMNEHVAASASLTRNAIDLPQGTFAGNLVRLRLDWSFTPRMFLNAFVQYNGESDAWLSNIRFNFIHRPLSDIYLVWNETRLPGETRRALLLKYTHLIAF
jgi:hypothetical protein